MPFKNLEEAKKKHPNLNQYTDKAQRAWLHAINSCFASGGTDESCFKIGYAAASKAGGKKANILVARELVRLAKEILK